MSALRYLPLYVPQAAGGITIPVLMAHYRQQQASAMFLKQSTSQAIRFGPCLDITDGVTEETGLTLAQADIRLSKDGGAFAQKNGVASATHDSDGWYSVTLDATDTNTCGELVMNVHQPANMLPVMARYYVLEETIYDSLFATSAAAFDANQRVDVGQWLSNAVTASTGNPDVNIETIDDIDVPATWKASMADAVWDETMAGHTTADTSGLVMNDWQDAGRLDAILDELTVNVDAVETDTQDIQTRLPAELVNSRMDSTIDGTGMEAGAVTNILTTQMTEAYAANGVAPTLAQALFAIHQVLMQFGISGTAWTVRQLDDTTTAFVLTLDDAAAPTDLKRV